MPVPADADQIEVAVAIKVGRVEVVQGEGGRDAVARPVG